MQRLISSFLTVVFISISLVSCSKIEPAAIDNDPPIESSEATSTSSSEIAEVTIPSTVASGVVRIAFGGDTFMDMMFAEYSNLYGVTYPWEDIAPIFQNSDIGFVNLETSVSTQGSTTKPEGYGFRTSPDKLEGYHFAGINAVSGANNHVIDFGRIALADTMYYLNEYDIKYTGIGSNLEDSRQAIFFEENGVKVGVVAYSDILPSTSWVATNDQSGFNGITAETLPLFLSDIKKFDKMCDVLIVSVHWGVEHTQVVSSRQKELSRLFIDNGADMILGHHPHVLQPIEFYNEKPIFYSLGNLLFLKADDKAGRTAVFRAEFNKDGFISAKLFPVNISGCKANILAEDNMIFNNILANMSENSAPFGTGISKLGEITPYLNSDPPQYIPEPPPDTDENSDLSTPSETIPDNMPQTINLPH